MPKTREAPKAQSAMEYLTTYGWAILIVAVILAALYELGALNPSSPSACIAQTGYTCLNPSYTSNAISFAVGQNTGQYFYAVNVFAASQAELLNGAGIPQNFSSSKTSIIPVNMLPIGTLTPGETVSVNLTNLQAGGFGVNSPVGTAINGYVWLAYCLSPCSSPSNYARVAMLELRSSGVSLSGTTTTPTLSSTTSSSTTSSSTSSSTSSTSSTTTSSTSSTTSSTSTTTILVAQFSGSSYIQLPQGTDAQAPLVLSAWVYPTTFGSNEGVYIMAADPGMRLAINPSGYPWADVQINGAWQNAVISSISIPLNAWSFLTAETSGNTEYIYVNGVQEGSVGISSGSITYTSSTPYVIGSDNYQYNSYHEDFGGDMANVQEYSTALTSAQIQQLYSEGVGGQTLGGTAVVGWWPLDGNANDYSGNGYNGATTNINYIAEP